MKKNEVLDALRSLGIKEGMTLEVHSSLSSIGYVEGGAETVIEALKEVVGSEGSIFMPALRLSRDLPLSEEDKRNGLLRKIRILKDDEKKSAMGCIADTFRLLPDTAVKKGTFAAAAWGKHADQVEGMFQYLIENGGTALMIGVDIYSLTAMHHVETYLPEEISAMFKSARLDELYDKDKWFVEDGTTPIKAWYTIQKMAYEKGLIKDGTIGKAHCMVMDVKGVVSLYKQELLRDPYGLYGVEKR